MKEKSDEHFKSQESGKGSWDLNASVVIRPYG
jgi:hypothetical protein